ERSRFRAQGAKTHQTVVDWVKPAQKTLPNPALAARRATEVIGVGQNDFGAISGWRIVPIVLAGSDPVRRAVEESAVAAFGILEAHANGMLFGFGLLAVVNEPDEMVLPQGRVTAGRVRDFIEDIVKIVDRVDDFANIGFL